MRRSVIAAAFLAGLATVAMPAAAITLQTANNEVGNQDWSSGVAVAFHVNSAIKVTSLGVFDSAPDGLEDDALLTAVLMTSAGLSLASAAFTDASPGTLIDDYRFKSVGPVILGPGDYVLVGYGWDPLNLEHNCNNGGTCATFNDGGGLVTYLNSPYNNPGDAVGTLPSNIWPTDQNFFSAANMQFEAADVPEPASLALLGAGLAALGLMRRRRGAA